LSDAIVTAGMLLIVLEMFMLRLILPVAAIVMGAIRCRRSKKHGKALLIAGCLWMAASLALWITEGILYGFA